MLIAGGTGGGKTYFIFSPIEALARTERLTTLKKKAANLDTPTIKKF
jgi:Flp pilus assembly CpaF family ATPase